MLLWLLKTKKRLRVKLSDELTIRAVILAMVIVETATLWDKKDIARMYTQQSTKKDTKEEHENFIMFFWNNFLSIAKVTAFLKDYTLILY